jgi:enoyl-CoA hydratase/carnithine racemase
MIPSLEIDGHVAYLTLRRPQAANKLTPEDLPELIRHVETVNRSPDVLVLILRSGGKYFCSGYDISEMASSSQTEGRSFGDMVDALENCRAVTIAAVHGGVFGGATDLVLACDFRVGVRTAEKLDGPAMRDCGFLTRLVDDAAALDAEVLRLRTTLAGMAPLAMLGMKKHLNQIARGTADAASILREVQRTVASEDLAEGGRAWREKRPPVFKGR